MDLLWGLKTVATFDVWSFEHILSGVSVGSAVKKSNKKHLRKLDHRLSVWNGVFVRYAIIFVLLCAYIWEAVEHYLETGLAGGLVEYWFQGVEAWPNRLVADPLMLVVGYTIALYKPHWVWPARLFSIAWLILHIFIFPHSMYLHYLF